MTQTSVTQIERPAGLDRAAVEAFSRERGEPDWLREARLVAWERYEALPKPTTRDETWRRTDISALDLDRLAVPATEVGGGLAGADALTAALGETTERAGLLLLRNGKVERRTLDDKLARRGVLLMSLAEAVSEKPDLVREYF